MTALTVAILGTIAEDHWGMFTTAQAIKAGISPYQLSRLVAAGALERLAQGVYRMAGAPASQHETLRATWLSLGGYQKSAEGIPDVIAAGTTAAELHNVGDFYLDSYDFVVPRRRGTRLKRVRLRVRELTQHEFTYVNGMPVLTVERTIADLVEMNVDRSLIADVIADVHRDGKLASQSLLDTYLDPLARRNRHESGSDLRNSLFKSSGVMT